jgi:hypothetical protein
MSNSKPRCRFFVLLLPLLQREATSTASNPAFGRRQGAKSPLNDGAKFSTAEEVEERKIEVLLRRMERQISMPVPTAQELDSDSKDFVLRQYFEELVTESDTRAHALARGCSWERPIAQPWMLGLSQPVKKSSSTPLLVAQKAVVFRCFARFRDPVEYAESVEKYSMGIKDSFNSSFGAAANLEKLARGEHTHLSRFRLQTCQDDS